MTDPTMDPDVVGARRLLASYMAWRRAAVAVQRAHKDWREQKGPGRVHAYQRYLAARETEKEAASNLERAVDRRPGDRSNGGQ